MSAYYKIYGYDGCPYCQKAKALLTKEGIAFDYFDVGDDKEKRSKWLDEAGFEGDQRTFPRVFIYNGHREIMVGGYVDLENHLLFG